MADAQDWERLFSQVDKNGNGSLTAGEMAREMINIGYPGTEAKIKAFLCAADHSGDRQLSKQEFLDAMESAPIEFQIAALLHTVFSRFDTTGDGEITRDEFRRALRQMGRNLSDEQVADLINRIDSDNSGTINIKEFLVAVKHRLF